MEIKIIAVSYHHKFNLGNFNSADLSCSLWAQITAGEDEDACVQILQDKCREHVRAEYCKTKNGSQPAELLRVNVANDKYPLLDLCGYVDEEKRTLTHSMFVSLFPNWTGQTQPRVVKIEGDVLHLSTESPIKSGGKTVMSYLRWKRASKE